jgi:hypothetical protein
MSSIMPDVANGGVVIRDAEGNCTFPDNVENAYCPNEAFTSTCALTALPTDCSARITPAQVNAIVSELMCLAYIMDPTGNWDCDSLCNLATAFNNSGGGGGGGGGPSTVFTDGTTITGDGQFSTPVRLLPQGAVNAICADNAAGDALATCLRSVDGANALVLGADGRLFVAASGFSGSVVAGPAAVLATSIATDIIGDAAKTMGAPVRWIQMTVPGVSGLVTIPSYT